MHLFGFNSVKEALLVITGAKYKAFAMIDLCVSVILALSFDVIGITEKWVWSPFYSIVVYMCVLAADFISGVFVGMTKKREGFMTSKGQRLFIIFPTHFILLGVMFNLGRINADLGIKEIPASVFDLAARSFFFYVLIINLLSFAKNLSLLGLLKGKAAKLLEEYIDPHKNFEKPEGATELTPEPDKSNEPIS